MLWWAGYGLKDQMFMCLLLVPSLVLACEPSYIEVFGHACDTNTSTPARSKERRELKHCEMFTSHNLEEYQTS